MTAEGDSGRKTQTTQYEAIADSIAAPAYFIDNNWKLSYANQSAAQHQAVSLDEFRGGHVMDLIERLVTDDENLERFERALETVYEGGGDVSFPITVESRLDTPSGPVITEWRCSPCVTEGGTGALLVSREITERRNPDLEQYERLFETLPVAFSITTLGEWEQFDYVNQAATELFDADSRTELEQYSPKDLYADPEDRRQFADNLREEGSTDQYEVKFTTLSGERIWVSMSAELVEIDGKERVVRIIEDRSDRKQKQRELQEGEAFIDGVLDSLPDVFYAFDAEANLVEHNERLCAVTGYDHEEVQTMTPWEFFPEDEREMIMEAVGEVLETEEPVQHLEAHYLTKSGETVPYEFSGSPYYDSDGNVAGFVGFGRDITERQEREQRLKKLQQRMDVAVEGAGIGIWDWDIETDEVIFNEAWASMLGYDVDELDFHFRVWENLVHPADLEGVTAALDAHMAGETNFYEHEIRMQTKSGGWKWVWTIGQVVERDETGEPLRAAGIHIDIGDKKQTELELERSERQFEAVFNDPQMLVGVLDTEGVIQRVNKTAASTAGAPRQQIQGMAFADLWHNDDETGEPEIEKQVTRATDGEYVGFEAEAFTNDGEQTIVNGSLRPVTDDDGEVLSVVASGRDITERRDREQELQEKRERLRGLFDEAPDPMFVQDEAGNFTDANEKAAEKLGYPREDLLDMRAPDIDTSVDPADAEELLSKIKAEGETIEIEGRHLRADGSTYPVDVRVTPLETDEHDRFLSHARDITERKEREQELERNQEFLAQTQEVADVGGWEVNLRTETQQWTDESYRIHGLPLDEDLTVDEGIDFYHPDDQNTVREAFERLTTEAEPYDLEVRLVRDDGEIRWVRTIGDPWYKNGEIVGARGTIQDITKRKERERELERKQKFLEQTQEVADVGGWEVDLRDDSLKWTEEVYRIHGVKSEFEPTVEDAIDLYHPEDRETVQNAVDRAISEGEPYDHEVRIVRPDGEIRWTRARGEAWVEGDEIVGVRGTFQDITERVEREQELRESNERLEQFAYVASHDLQEPLRTISNYTEILAEEYADELNEDAREIIDVAVTGSDRMQSMINGLLDYSRVTTRGDEFETVDAGEAVAETVDDLAVMLDEHDGTVEIGELPTVEADNDQLHQVFQNLIKNALEHSGDGTVTIDIQASEQSTHHRFEVADNGPGIEESRQDKIFRIFNSGQQYQTESEARGLGLAICDNIIRRHGGEIWVESGPGEGATFVFTIEKNTDTAKTATIEE